VHAAVTAVKVECRHCVNLCGPGSGHWWDSCLCGQLTAAKSVRSQFFVFWLGDCLFHLSTYSNSLEKLKGRRRR
jgi:hypothetical protein